MRELVETVSLDVNPTHLWARTLESLRTDGKSYALTWLERMKAIGFRDHALVLSVPDRFFRDWVDDHYRELLEQALTRQTGAPAKVEYEVVEGSGLGEHPSSEHIVPIADSPRPNRLNERFTFSTYVVADSNQLPAAAAAAVAENPGRAYNPLFIYGGTGLGKTHLLHAVGNKIFDKNTSARIVYLSSEEFTNQFV